MLYGEPRVTHDIDLIAFLRLKEIAQIRTAYPEPAYYAPPAEVLALEMRREQRGHFNIIHIESALKADFYLAGNDELHAWAIKLTKQYSVQNSVIHLAPPEYVILRKLEFFREGGSEKHIRDIRSMLDISGSFIDQQILESWIHRRGLAIEWNKAKE